MNDDPENAAPWDPTDFLVQYYATRFDPDVEIGSDRANLAEQITAILVRDNVSFAGVSSLDIRREAVGRKLVELIEAGDFASFRWISERLECGLNASREIVVLMELIDKKGGELPTIKEWNEAREKPGSFCRKPASDKTEAAFRKRLLLDLKQARKPRMTSGVAGQVGKYDPLCSELKR